jgi:hypothetical protein
MAGPLPPPAPPACRPLLPYLREAIETSMQSGASPAAAQRIMRHSDPRITAEVHGHLAPEYLRAEVDRLQFGTTPACRAHRRASRARHGRCRQP